MKNAVQCLLQTLAGTANASNTTSDLELLRLTIIYLIKLECLLDRKLKGNLTIDSFMTSVIETLSSVVLKISHLFDAIRASKTI